MFKILTDFFVGTVLCIIFLILKVLGKRISSNLCATIFCTFGALTKYEHIAKKNILFVWPAKKETEVKKITNKMWKNIGRNFGELIHLKNYKPLNCAQTKIIDLKKVEQLISLNKKKKTRNSFFFCSLRKLGVRAYCN
jgi:lauroyl/myristoyl acyltransferase